MGTARVLLWDHWFGHPYSLGLSEVWESDRVFPAKLQGVVFFLSKNLVIEKLIQYSYQVLPSLYCIIQVQLSAPDSASLPYAPSVLSHELLENGPANLAVLCASAVDPLVTH